jgi:hypothetical protein
MGRLRVTPKGKVKHNRPITRIGKKQYEKRRFAHVRKIERAQKMNPFASEYMKREHTALQNYTRVGLNMDPSAKKEVVKERKRKIKPEAREKFKEPEAQKGSVARPVSEEEGTMLCNLVEKYDNDFKRMSLDRKLNPFQLTPRQLQKKVLNYLKWEREAFPEMYADAEAQGLELDDYKDPKLRLGKRGVEAE